MWQKGYCGDLLSRGLNSLAGSSPVIPVELELFIKVWASLMVGYKSVALVV